MPTQVLEPYIGIMVKKKNKHSLCLERAVYAELYSDIGGTLLLFGPDQVDTKARKISGQIFNSQSRSWESGSFSYPSSVLNKAMTPKPLIEHLKKTIGKAAVINDYRLDKWQIYKRLARTELRRHLPKTILYRNPSDITRMPGTYAAVYFKPLLGSGGKNIWKLSKKRGSFMLTQRTAKESVTRSFVKRKKLANFLSRHLVPQRYIIQQSIDLISQNNSLIDFRMVLVKDECGKWQDQGLFARIGSPKCIVSNIAAGGRAENGCQLLEKHYAIGEKEVAFIRTQMFLLAKKAAKHLEESGVHLGNLGMDFGIDLTGHIWLLEVNHNDPDHTIALDAGDQEAYMRIMKSNLQYAITVAGFSNPAATYYQ
jgi:glutathione synthase/RimK-type ligase-like ATP-grasp enzyme